MKANTAVAAAPRTPAAISTASAPKAFASGPTTRNDTGVPRIEIIQSNDDTRPSSSPGTNRCMAVNQITIKTAIDRMERLGGDPVVQVLDDKPDLAAVLERLAAMMAE